MRFSFAKEESRFLEELNMNFGARKSLRMGLVPAECEGTLTTRLKLEQQARKTQCRYLLSWRGCEEDASATRQDGLLEDMGSQARTTLGGPTKRSVEAATMKKARSNTGCTIVRHGGKSETRSLSVWRNGKHRAEWCAATSRCRCMRCGRNNTLLKTPGKCGSPGWLEKDFNHKLKRWGKAHLGEHDMARRVGPNGEVPVW